LDTEAPKLPPGKPLGENEDDPEVGVTRPPPTAELKPIRDELGFDPGPDDSELGEEMMAARDSCAKDVEALPRCRFCSEPIPKGPEFRLP
jgi:hypothetical protein